MYDYSEFARPEGTSWYDDLDIAIAAGVNRLCLFGPPGTGKTTTALMVARKVNAAAENITIDRDTTRGTLLDMNLPGGENGKWITVLGPAARAMEKGYPLVVNELDRVVESSAETCLHAIADDPAIASWTLLNGKVIRPAAGFAFYATMNGTPDMLPSALRDRFDTIIYADRPHPAMLARIASPALRRCADAIFADNPAQWPLSPRNVLRIDTMLAKGVEFDAAARIVIPEHALRDRFSTVFAAHMTETVTPE